MRIRTLKHVPSLLALVFGANLMINVGSAYAQRTEPSREERREQRRQQTENMTEEERQKFREQRRQEWQSNMTPEQRQRFEQRRQQWQQQRGEQGQGAANNDGGGGDQNSGAAATNARENAQRALMNSALITDRATQDAIIAFVNAQAEARKAVAAKAHAVSGALADESVAPEKISVLLTTFRQFAEQDQVRYKAALADLDEQINYSTTPRLQAFLALIGVLGDDATAAGGFSTIFPTGLAGGPEAQAAYAASAATSVATAPEATR